MKKLYHLDISKEDFWVTLVQVMLISKRVTKNKKGSFRFLNVRIAKIILLKDVFSLLESSRCEDKSIFDLYSEFNSLRLPKNSEMLWIFTIF